MNAIILSKEEFDEMKNDLKEVKDRICNLTAPEERIIENQEFLKMMKVSYKTARGWRNDGKIGYTKEGNKIYYRMSDVRDFLELYHYKAFATNDNPF